MNWIDVSCNWKRAGERIRVTWGKLSDADIATINGDREQLANVLQRRYRFSEAKVEQMITNFPDALGSQ
ncbi:MAG: hypothetical protein KDA91_20485 [Planctomycetaceae bacterium]|nr:hypothetical protein [Planctomycetaceae bacterium]